MGSTYDNIHLHSTNREAIELAWQHYWDGRTEPSRAFISPAYGGWVSVYDWQSDLPDTDTLTELAAHLSRALDTMALAFQVQESALAEYWVFHQGRELDHYTSNTEYYAAYAQQTDVSAETGVYDGFGPDGQASSALEEDNTDGGNCELLKSLTGSNASDLEMEAILRTPATIADDILTALASLIGINDIWASLGYAALVSEGDTIMAYEQFHHLPPHEPPHVQ